MVCSTMTDRPRLCGTPSLSECRPPRQDDAQPAQSSPLAAAHEARKPLQRAATWAPAPHAGRHGDLAPADVSAGRAGEGGAKPRCAHLRAGFLERGAQSVKLGLRLRWARGRFSNADGRKPRTARQGRTADPSSEPTLASTAVCGGPRGREATVGACRVLPSRAPCARPPSAPSCPRPPRPRRSAPCLRLARGASRGGVRRRPAERLGEQGARRDGQQCAPRRRRTPRAGSTWHKRRDAATTHVRRACAPGCANQQYLGNSGAAGAAGTGGTAFAGTAAGLDSR
jgi:hypothetical protein